MTFWAILKNVNVWVNIAVTTSWQIEVKIEDTFYSKLWSHWIRVGVSKALGTYLFGSQWMSGKRLAKLYLAVNVGWVSSRGVPTDYHIHNSPSVCFSTLFSNCNPHGNDTDMDNVYPHDFFSIKLKFCFLCLPNKIFFLIPSLVLSWKQSHSSISE